MPLIHSKSEPAFRANVKNLMHEAKAGTSAHVKSPQQALAIAYSIKRRGRADGGAVGHLSDADEALGLSKQESALYKRHLDNLWGSGGVDNPDGSRSSLYQAVQEHNGKFYNIPTVWNGKREVEPYVHPRTGQMMDVPNQTAIKNVEKEGWDKFPSYDTPDEADRRYDDMHQFMEQDTSDYLQSRTPAMARGGALNVAYKVGREKRAFGGFMPWASKPSASQTMKNEVRAMHKGPVLSAVAGRTDHHPTAVPSGSYVLTADHLSSLGQGNTLAGMKQVHNMFRSGPHGVSAPKITHGSGPPKPPRLMHAKGGAAHHDHSVGHPTPVAIAGGEDVLAPDEILNWMERNGFPRDLKLGHAALDAWQTAVRKETIRKLKKLPGPAKS